MRLSGISKCGDIRGVIRTRGMRIALVVATSVAHADGGRTRTRRELARREAFTESGTFIEEE